MTEKVLLLLEDVERNIPDVDVIPDCDMSARCTFRTGGTADLALVPRTVEALVGVLRAIKRHGIPYKILGNGSNVLPPDGTYAGVIVYTTELTRVENKAGVIYAECGVPLGRFVKAYVSAGGVGAEELYGIPGTVGGGVFMNAGAYGREVRDLILRVHAYDVERDECITLSLSDLSMEYRSSIFQKKRNYVILASEFSLLLGDTSESEDKMRSIAERRRASQPLEYPNAGSTFKRPTGYFAGKLIEDAGLKGRRVGGASVSEKHAGFVVNLGDATTGDVLALIDVIKKEVYEKFGVALACEVEHFH